MINREPADNEIKNPLLRRLVIATIPLGLVGGIGSVAFQMHKAAEKMPQPIVDTIAVGGGCGAAVLAVYLMGTKTKL
jgi:hypothetical protein